MSMITHDNLTTLWYITPAYNEESRIEMTLEFLIGLKRKLETEELRLIPILVDDGSIDGTYRIMCRYMNSLEGLVIKIRHGGRGAALIEGIKAIHKASCTSKGRGIIVLSSADLKLPSEDLVEACRLILKEGYDAVFLSKNIPGSLIKRSVLRRTLSLLFNRLVRLLFNLPYKDTQGVKFIRLTEKTLRLLEDCTMGGFLYDTEATIHLHNHDMSIKEVPCRLMDSSERGSKVNFYSIILMAFGLISLLKSVRRVD